MICLPLTTRIDLVPFSSRIIQILYQLLRTFSLLSYWLFSQEYLEIIKLPTSLSNFCDKTIVIEVYYPPRNKHDHTNPHTSDIY